MTVMETYIRFWKKAFHFKGRARRKEFWIPTLTNIIIGAILGIISDMIGNATGANLNISAVDTSYAEAIFNLIVFIPSLSVACRRLQDININGLWYIIPMVTITLVLLCLSIPFLMNPLFLESNAITFMSIVGGAFLILAIMFIVYFVMFLIDGTNGPNKFGEDPKRDERYADPF